MSNIKPSDPLLANGQSKTLAQWATELGCPVQTLMGRLQRGWSPDRTISTPIGKTGGGNRGQKLAVEVLTSEEMQKLLNACNDGVTGIRNRALIVLGWRAGLRISEAIALRPKDLDDQARAIRVLHGKGNKARTVGLDDQAWQYIRTWSTSRAALPIKDTDPLFCTLGGGELNDRYVRALMPRLAAAAGLTKRIHFHALRHTLAFELAQEGMPMHLIQQQLGHSNLAITSRYINHLNPAETIARMKTRTWNGPSSSLPSPGWLDRLKSEIGQHLIFLHDARTNQEQFKAIMLLF